MEDFLKIITHARRFKSATKDLDVEQLQDVKGKLDKIIEDRIAEEVEAKRKDAEKLEKIERIRQMMVADGIDPEELVGESVAKPSKRAPRPPKYEILNEDGDRITWTGQGRMPKVFKARVDAGESIDNYLIK